LFLLLSFLESIKKAGFYVLENQWSAARPQAGATYFVHSATQLAASSLSDRHFSGIYSESRERQQKAQTLHSVKIKARILWKAEFAAIRNFFFASFAASFAIFAVKISYCKAREKPAIR
jgi:hypothetical protein